MPKIKKSTLKHAILLIICLIVVIIVPVMSLFKNNGAKASNGMTVLTLWQIDAFEGGRGSRAAYLQDIAHTFSKDTNCYITVTSLSSSAALLNIAEGSLPDIISFGAGMCGIESYLGGETPYYTWCNGGYCFLALDNAADFNDVSTENLIINEGTDNLVGAAALLCGVNGADTDKPTCAYVKLINGEYKYLLGTQRDVFRLKTRGVQFSVKPITQFNDLYQNISVLSKSAKKRNMAEKFIAMLISKSDNIGKIGLMARGKSLYDDEMHIMENIEYSNKLVAPVSESAKNEIKSAIINCDIKKLKNLLN